MTRPRSHVALATLLTALASGVVALAPPHGAAVAAGTVRLYAPATATALDTISLYGQASDADPDAQWSWDLDGDGTYEIDTFEADHTTTYLLTPGTHTVGVKVVTNGEDLADTATITVTEPPLARLRMSPAAPLLGQKVTLAAPGRGGPVAQTWKVEGVKATRSTTILRSPSQRAITLDATAANLGTTIDVAGTGLDVTKDNKISTHVPANATWDEKVVTIKSTSMYADGTRMSTTKSTQITDDLASGYANKVVSADVAWDCEDLPTYGPATGCAVMSHSQARAKAPTQFVDGTPGLIWCTPVDKTPKPSNTSVSEWLPDVQDLESYWGPLSPQRGARATGSGDDPVPTRFHRRGEACLKVPAKTVSWNFGDGSGTLVPTTNAPVHHEFSEPGTYKVRLRAKIPYLLAKDGTLSKKRST